MKISAPHATPLLARRGTWSRLRREPHHSMLEKRAEPCMSEVRNTGEELGATTRRTIWSDTRLYNELIKFYKTPLARQVAEAIRIRRRGVEGAILNSKSEFSRCYIPRLKVENDGELDKEIEQSMRKEELRNERELAAMDATWEEEKIERLGGGASGPKIKPNSKMRKLLPQEQLMDRK